MNVREGKVRDEKSPKIFSSESEILGASVSRKPEPRSFNWPSGMLLFGNTKFGVQVDLHYVHRFLQVNQLNCRCSFYDRNIYCDLSRSIFDRLSFPISHPWSVIANFQHRWCQLLEGKRSDRVECLVVECQNYLYLLVLRCDPPLAICGEDIHWLFVNWILQDAPLIRTFKKSS